MNLIFVSRDPELVAHWNLFKPALPEGVGIYIHELSLGTFLEAERVDAILAPGNSFGIMSGGFDKAIIEAVGEHVQDSVDEYIRERWHGMMPVGSAGVVHLDEDDVIDHVIYSPTMRIPMELQLPTDIPYITTYAAFSEIQRHNRKTMNERKQIQSLIITGHGAGTGGVPAKVVAWQQMLAVAHWVHQVHVENLSQDGEALHSLIISGMDRWKPVDPNLMELAKKHEYKAGDVTTSVAKHYFA